MVENIDYIAKIFDTFLKLKKSLESLKISNLFIKDTDLYNLIEKYFALEPLPNSRIKLTGKLSNYTITNNLPVYYPSHFNIVSETKKPEYNPLSRKIQNKIELHAQSNALSIPSIVHNSIEMADKSIAKILWLFPEQTTGLVFRAGREKPVSDENLSDLFNIQLEHKPIPVLVDKNFPNHYLYKVVRITGIISTSPLEYFKDFSSNSNPFLLDYYSNCFRPLSEQEGVLAIDARTPNGKFEILSDNKDPFNVIYTVQGLIEIPEAQIGKIRNDSLVTACVDAIPDRQGMGNLKSFGFQGKEINSIISIGDIKWQDCFNDLSIAAFKEVNVNDPAYSQANLSQLAHNWQAWQKAARKAVRDNFNFEPKIHPIICSNTIHEKSFHPNGLQISSKLESMLNSEFPEVRRSIDWLGVSTGKV